MEIRAYSAAGHSRLAVQLRNAECCGEECVMGKNEQRATVRSPEGDVDGTLGHIDLADLSRLAVQLRNAECCGEECVMGKNEQRATVRSPEGDVDGTLGHIDLADLT